jgi:predicted amidohydrolase YtcJ
MASSVDLLLTNARVLTLEQRQPLADAVGVRGETIVSVGNAAQVGQLKGKGTEVIDCRGLTLLPGLVDAHCHILALAASLTGVDCSAGRVGSISELKRVISQEARQKPPGQWIRGYGYDDLSLAEGRHPTRWDLDAAAPHHPVRLDHRSDHAVVLNSLALGLAGVYRETPDPPEGVIERDQTSGEPTGVLLEMSGFLTRNLGGIRDKVQFEQGIANLNRKLLEYGITSVQDAGPNNGLARWSTLQDLKDSGKLASRITMMVGAPYLDEFLALGMDWGMGDNQLRLGHAKIMLTLTTGSLQPDSEELRRIVSPAHQAGFPVAVHAVEAEAVMAAARVLGEEPSCWKLQKGPAGLGKLLDRIEHCSECPPAALEQVKSCGAAVVTQPGFVYWSGDRYLEHVPPELRPHLYAIGALDRAGVLMAFSSDAPVVDPNPWPAIYSAVTRFTRNGSPLPQVGEPGQGQGVSVLDALRMYTAAGARVEGRQSQKGSIRAGKLADLVLVDADPTEVELSALRNIKAVLTIVGGKLLWDGGLQ